MNIKYVGDSFDLVKRFFCNELSALGYIVTVEPMFTDTWNDQSKVGFFRFIGATPQEVPVPTSRDSVLFLDPDKGVNEKGGSQHVSFDRLAMETSKHTLVFSFDQSFSRQKKAREVMKNKFAELRGRGCHAMYYDSHARFLFASERRKPLRELHAHLLSLGIPPDRLLESDA